MFGKKKKEEGLPDLPSYPRVIPSMKDYSPEEFKSSIKEEREELHELPSFPDTPMKKGFSQTAIKDAVENEEENLKEVSIPKLPSEYNLPKLPHSKIIEMDEWNPTKENTTAHLSPQKPIFIRLDKFKDAEESLQLMKEKLGEMDEILKNIREVNNKENEELSKWEIETEKIKARINSIVSGIFENASQ
jgi:hypothetical protein